ncbi:MAG: MBOAT family protein [Alphaproteobacteria bacterium]|nr:MBOAT family protein [Alphaproteobacteria bacterium]
MVFSSYPFFAFFIVYLLLHVVVPARHRLALIIIGSTIFYGAWNPYLAPSQTAFTLNPLELISRINYRYVWLPHVLMLVAYLGVLWMEAAVAERHRKQRMIIVTVALLTPLAVVKYTDFLYADVLGPVFGWSGRPLGIALPLGISFVTFTLIAYVVDVYRRKYPVERRAGLLAGLVLFFPHLIAGPILRPHELLPQLAKPRPARRALGRRLVFGLAVFSWGLFKKSVLADPLAGTVDHVYTATGGLTAIDYLLAIYGFTLQIYCDFSGYTDMAIGVALMIGVRLPMNFRQPYAAVSIVEFWRRWHITLSTWLRDYLYIPLGGNRYGRARQLANLMITMLLGGLWHGANWTFVLWGALHGGAIALVHAVRWSPLSGAVRRVPAWIWLLVTFHFVTWVWVPFRAPDMATAMRVALGPFTAPLGDWPAALQLHAFPIALLAIFLVSHRWDNHRTIHRWARRLPQAVFWPLIALIWALAITLSQGSSKKFVYFDF